MQPIFLGGHPLIDFLNTSLAPDGERVEVLADGKAYKDWLVCAKLLDESQAERAWRRFGTKAFDAAAAEARRVREWMRDWLERWRKSPRADYAEEIAALNKLLERDCRTAALVREKDGFSIVESREPQSAQALLSVVATQLAELIAGEDPALVKSCASARCSLWFLDTTKSHRKLYCSSSVCGNRAKVAAYRQRQKG